MFCVLFLTVTVTCVSVSFGGDPDRDLIDGEYLFVWSKVARARGLTEEGDFFRRMRERFGDCALPKLELNVGEHRAYLLKNITAAQAQEMQQDVDPGFRFMEQNRRVRAFESETTETATSAPTTSSEFCLEQDSMADDLWGLTRIDQRTEVGRTGSFSWRNVDDDGAGVDVYVIDSGVTITHNDFEGRAKHGFTAGTISEEGSKDLNGHGTHVAGTVGGATYGVAKNANIIAVKVLNEEGVGSIADIIDGIEFALADFREKGSRKAVINMSLGSSGFSLLLQLATMEAINAGIHVVVAAGNDFDDACDYTPASVADAITVAASNDRDDVTSFSNFGACVDIFAPGEDIWSASSTGGNARLSLSGTSMAAPHVAGALARLLSRYDNPLTPREATKLMMAEATRGVIDLSRIRDSSQRSNTIDDLLYIDCYGSSGSRASVTSCTVVTLVAALASYVLFTFVQ